MSGPIPLLPLYAFMVLTGATLPFPLPHPAFPFELKILS
jgi:hypothetical protein